jgi:hypothetical protein
LSGEILFVTAEKVKDFIAEARSAVGDTSTATPAKRAAGSAAWDGATEYGKLFCDLFRLAPWGRTGFFFSRRTVKSLPHLLHVYSYNGILTFLIYLLCISI